MRAVGVRGSRREGRVSRGLARAAPKWNRVKPIPPCSPYATLQCNDIGIATTAGVLQDSASGSCMLSTRPAASLSNQAQEALEAGICSAHPLNTSILTRPSAEASTAPTKLERAHEASHTAASVCEAGVDVPLVHPSELSTGPNRCETARLPSIQSTNVT